MALLVILLLVLNWNTYKFFLRSAVGGLPPELSYFIGCITYIVVQHSFCVRWLTSQGSVHVFSQRQQTAPGSSFGKQE